MNNEYLQRLKQEYEEKERALEVNLENELERNRIHIKLSAIDE